MKEPTAGMKAILTATGATVEVVSVSRSGGRFVAFTFKHLDVPTLIPRPAGDWGTNLLPLDEPN